jgi:Tfp pilus assembly protein PilO
MFFMHRPSRWYSFAATIKPLYRYLLTLACFAACIVGWFALYNHLETRIELQQRSITTARQQIIFLSRAGTESEKLATQAHELNDQFSAQVKKIANAQASPLIVIAQTAKAAHINLATCTAGDEQLCEWYTEKNIAFKGNGSLQHITHFFDALKKGPSLIHCSRMQIQHIAGDSYSFSCALQAVQELR